MAAFIQSSPSIGNGPLPDNAGDLIRTEEWGIDNTLSGFIIQSEEIAEEAITDTTQDQKGAVVSQLDYDKHWTLTLGLIGDTTAPLPEVGDIEFSYAGHNWKVTNVSYAGAYNDKKKWTITAERWYNFPAST